MVFNFHDRIKSEIKKEEMKLFSLGSTNEKTKPSIAMPSNFVFAKQ